MSNCQVRGTVSAVVKKKNTINHFICKSMAVVPAAKTRYWVSASFFRSEKICANAGLQAAVKTLSTQTRFDFQPSTTHWSLHRVFGHGKIDVLVVKMHWDYVSFLRSEVLYISNATEQSTRSVCF